MLDLYLSKGWAIFPCNGKIPLTPNGFKDATKDPITAALMFAKFNNPNIGIMTGNGIFVVDIDVKNSKNGEQSLLKLLNENGAFPKTVEAKTPSGGRHIYFRCDKPIGCKVDLRLGIDIKGDGGYVLAPPSIFEGRQYTWILSPQDTEIASAPAWLVSLIDAKKPVIEESDILASSRNDTLMRMGVSFRKAGLEYELINQSLQNINATRCKPPLDSSEVSIIARSVARYEIGNNILKEPFTDVWNAKLFAQKYGESVRFCDQLGGWFIWDGTRWQLDQYDRIIGMAEYTIKQMLDTSKSHESKELFKHAVKTESEGRIKSMLNLAKANNLMLGSDDFDRNSFLLNFLNGTLNLKTMEFRKHDRADYITKRIDYNYNPDSFSEVWDEFLDDIFCFDQDLKAYMQKVIGYSLSGDTSEHAMFILFGTGMNGKSTFLKHIYRILSNYAMNTPATTFQQKSNDSIPNDIARLKGARFVTAMEFNDNKRLAENLIKQFTGDDVISARFLHREFFDFLPTFKIFIATNHKPVITGTDRGIWRRIVLVPFNKVIGENEKDLELDEKLAKEYEGIINWAIKGFALWQKEHLIKPEIINQAVEEYKTDSDLMQNFLDEMCIQGSTASVVAKDLYAAYKTWCGDNSIYILGRNRFFEQLKQKGFKLSKGNMNKNYFSGLALQ